MTSQIVWKPILVQYAKVKLMKNETYSYILGFFSEGEGVDVNLKIFNKVENHIISGKPN